MNAETPPSPDRPATDPRAGERRDDASSRYEDGGYYDHANPYLEDLLEPGHQRVLDVGCGAGALGGRWKRARPDCDIWGLERDERAAALADARLDRVLRLDLDDLDDLPGGAGHFDLIALGDVLEHLREPQRLLRALVHSLTPVGEVVISVPNVAHWSVLVELLAGRFTYRDEGLLDRTHVHLFTPTTCRSLLDEVGLATVTRELRITVPSPVSGSLAQVGAVLEGRAGQRDREDELHRDFDTYQTVFRARPPLSGPLTGLVVRAVDGGDADARRAVANYVDGFRAGEPVRLVVVLPATAGGAEAAWSLVEAATASLPTPVPEALRPEVHALTDDPHRTLADQLPPGPVRYLAVGRAAQSELPGAVAAGDDRLGLLQAVRAA
ncbi:MAG: class I SAM-dependent methyltransferase [Acidimicrobiales bacterium]